MAVMVDITIQRATSTGIVCNSTRPIVIFGQQVDQTLLDRLENGLSEARELYDGQAFVKSQSAIVTEVCNGILGKGHWDFIVQGGKIQF